MASSLNDPIVSRVLGALHSNADAVDPPLTSQVGERSDDEMAHVLDHAYMAIAPDVGRFLYSLVRAARTGTVVEFGTSLGISTIYCAAAVRDRGEGSVITTELNPSKVRNARENFREAGLLDHVELREGDALKTLRDVSSGVTVLFLDGWKKLYLPMLQMLEPALEPGAIVIADDLDLFPQLLQPYLAYVRNPANGYVSVTVPLGDSMELSVRA
jgi:predicted O-methyltransferase YrrM